MKVLNVIFVICGGAALVHAKEEDIRGRTEDKPELVKAKLEERMKNAKPIEMDVPEKGQSPIENGDLFEGDISASFEEMSAAYGEKLAIQLEKVGIVKRAEKGDRRLDTTTNSNRLWKQRAFGRVVIPYRYASGASFTDSQKNVIDSALDDLEQKTGVLRFIPRSTHTDFIEITSANTGCWSKIGRQGGKQTINLQNPGCVYHGIVQHEFMHALGFWHEQSRPDRDSFVDILWSNIKDDKKHNFEKRTWSEATTLGSPYDYKSVMHYGAYAFSKNGQKTIDSHGNAIGQNAGASESDITQIQLMYQCPDGPRAYSSFCSPDCPCKVDQGDCDSSADCAGDLVCEFGFFGTETCKSIWDRCSVAKPCPENAGDCDSDDECRGNLICKQQSGVDICVQPPAPTFPPITIIAPILRPTFPPLQIIVPSAQPSVRIPSLQPSIFPIKIVAPVSFGDNDLHGSDPDSDTPSEMPGSTSQAGATSEDDQQEASGNTIVYAAGGGAGVVFIAGLAAALLVHRRRKASAQREDTPTSVVVANPQYIGGAQV